MQRAKLGASGVEVSRVCLGTVFRSGADEQTCIRVIHRAAELGCNFLDSANVYREGHSERIVGQAVRGRRGQFVIATKAGAQAGADPASGGLSRQAILREAEASLRRLGTDYIDLYLCHFPDPAAPLEETMEALDELVRQGKIRYAGCSNFSAGLLSEASRISQDYGFSQFVCNQVPYSLIDRRIEENLIPFCMNHSIAATVYAATAIGLLSGRFRRGQPPPADTSWARGPYNYQAALTPRVDRIIQELTAIARGRGITPTQVAIAWCLSRPGITSAVVGADTPDQVEEDCAAGGITLGVSELHLLDQLSHGMRTEIRKDRALGYREEDPWPDDEASPRAG